MIELIKKFYWLVFTAIFSLFIFLCTALFNRAREIPAFIEHTFKEDKIPEWRRHIVNISINMSNRINHLEEIKSKLPKLDSVSFYENLEKSLEYDQQIRKDIIRAKNIIEESKEHTFFSPATRVYTDMTTHINNKLVFEIKIWEIIGDYSVMYIKDNKSFDSIQYRVDFLRQHNKIEAYNAHKTIKRSSSKFKNFIVDPLKGPPGKLLIDIVLFLLIGGLGYFIVKVLLPIGIEIWQSREVIETNDNNE